MTDTEKQLTLGDKLAAAAKPLSEKELAAARRDDHVRALEEEREALKNAGKDDRVKQVNAEIERVSGKPVGRSESEGGSTRVKQADVPDGDIAAVLNWVGTDPARAKAAIAVENKKDADKRRTGVLEPLTTLVDGK